MAARDLDSVVRLQSECFPGLDPGLLWTARHLERHMGLFPNGQFVAETDGLVVASCSNTVIAEANWLADLTWAETVGGHELDAFDSDGSTVYGLDISVSPEWRCRGIARALYAARFELTRRIGKRRYGTSCRLPGFRAWSAGATDASPRRYAEAVIDRTATDSTLTPLLRIGLRFAGVIENSMDDPESGNAAAKLEWTP